LAGFEISVKGPKEPGYFLSLIARTNLRGDAFFASQQVPAMTTEPALISL
jgi:hypothetical protein